MASDEAPERRGIFSIPGLPKHTWPGIGPSPWKHDGIQECDEFLVDRSGNGRDLIAVSGRALTQEEADTFGEELTTPKLHGIRLFADLMQLQAHRQAANAPAYEPLELLCGSYRAGERPQRYLLADVRRWAAGDFADLHSTPREVIATLAETVLMLLRPTTLTPVPGRDWIIAGKRMDIGLSVWVELRERHTPAATEEEIAARLEELRPWEFWSVRSTFSSTADTYDATHLEAWARGDLRDLRADAVTAMSGLAGEVLRLAGLE